MNVVVAAKSDVGQVREGNEDSYLVNDPLFAVADGMGGHLAGDVASSTAVEVIEIKSSEVSADDPETLARVLRSANQAIWEKAAADPSLRGMGTTCTLVLLDGARVHIAHVGDSRLYLMRNGELRQLTEDHTLVARMVKEGRLKAEDAERHPQRSIITRALGVDAEVQVDLDTLELEEGDRLLLCSDGLSSMIDHESIGDVLRNEDDPQAAAGALVALANDAGGEDNITVVLLDVTERPVERQTSPPATPTPSPQRPSRPPPEPVYPRRWPRRVLLTIVVLGVLGGGGFVAANWAVNNSWYVGVDADDKIGIYRGIPEEILGMEFSDRVQTTDLTLSDLPENLRDTFVEGRKVESRAEAERVVGDLQDRANDFKEIKKKPTPSPSPSPEPRRRPNDRTNKKGDGKQ
ncbi:MAG: Stp1/IreP family PP2C-type Ser/Thr phosphatase [Actinomycetota bacterium]|nr:Stp1/IreP family PP2C-type Ser/Thr phosphatase [Actinomycetota bacterium]